MADGRDIMRVDGPPSRARELVFWVVAFYGRPRNWWEVLWFKPGFRHCIAFAWIDSDRWLEFNPKLPRCEVKVLTGPQYSRRLQALDRAGATTIKAMCAGGKRHSPRIATCAGAIAHVLGVRGALLPHGLYRALADNLARGGIS